MSAARCPAVVDVEVLRHKTVSMVNDHTGKDRELVTVERSALVRVQCRHAAGHLADGSHAFAFHTANERCVERDADDKPHGTLGGKALVVWKDGQSTVSLPPKDAP